MGNQQEEWLEVAQATSLAGTSRRTLNRLCEAGRVKRQKGAGGTWQYSRADLELLIQSEDVGDPEGMLLAQAYSMINTLIGPARQFGEMVQTENEAMRARIRRLEEYADSLLTAKEKWLDQATERDLAAELVRQAEGRKQQALDVALKQGLPLIAAGVHNSAATRLLKSLTPEQVELLLNTDVISEDQKVLVKSVIETEQTP